MRYCDDAVAKALAEKQIAVLERLLSLVPAVKEVVKKFDGKVLNKRFDTALSNATGGRASCTKKTYVSGYELVLREYNDRYVYAPNADREYSSCHYIKQEYIFLADSAWLTSNWVTEDGRIKANELNAMIDLYASHAANEVKNLKEQLASVDSIIAEFDRISREREAFAKNTNHLLCSYFNLEF